MLKLINYLIIGIVVIFAILMVGVKLFGINIYTVLSGSMEPVYKVGSLIYVVDNDVSELNVGDVITFKLTDEVVATHRIVEIKEDNGYKEFYTKGDSNEDVDEKSVAEEDIIGKPIFTIPYLGYVASFMQTKSGSLIMIGVGFSLFVMMMMIDLIIDKNRKDKA